MAKIEDKSIYRSSLFHQRINGKSAIPLRISSIKTEETTSFLCFFLSHCDKLTLDRSSTDVNISLSKVMVASIENQLPGKNFIGTLFSRTNSKIQNENEKQRKITFCSFYAFVDEFKSIQYLFYLSLVFENFSSILSMFVKMSNHFSIITRHTELMQSLSFVFILSIKFFSKVSPCSSATYSESAGS